MIYLNFFYCMEFQQFVNTDLLYLKAFISIFLKRSRKRMLLLGEVHMSLSTQSSLI